MKNLWLICFLCAGCSGMEIRHEYSYHPDGSVKDHYIVSVENGIEVKADVYSYDTDDNLIRFVRFNADSIIFTYHEYEYFSDNILKKHQSWFYENFDIENLDIENLKDIRDLENIEGVTLKKRELYLYDEKGRKNNRFVLKEGTEAEEIDYFPNGQIKRQTHYKNDTDYTRHEYKYYPDDTLKEHHVFWVENNILQREEIYTCNEKGNIIAYIAANRGLDEKHTDYFTDGRIKSEAHYRNEIPYGVIRHYYSIGHIYRQMLYIQGKPMVEERWEVEPDAAVCSVLYFFETCPDAVSGWVYDRDMSVLNRKQSSYFQVSGCDTICEGETYTLHTEVLSGGIDCYISEAVFGDFDTTFTVRDSSKFCFLNSPDHRLDYSFVPSQNGYQYVVGKVSVKALHARDTLDRDFIVYKDFYVKPESFHP